jgi:putative hemolysin
MQPGTLLGRKAGLVVRTALGKEEIEAAQHLRYRVFYEELDARPQGKGNSRLDSDGFDACCDHLLVVQEADVLEPGSIPISAENW